VLESVLSEHPKVEAAAVVAKPDERWGERPLAAVKVREPVEKEELTRYLEERVKEGRIAKFWVPDDFVFVQDFPVTSAGKVHKVALREKLGLA